MRLSPMLIFIVMLSVVSCKQQNKINTLSSEEQNAGWQLLFNGKTTDGWRLFKGGLVTGWKVENGMLRNSGIGSDHGGDIITTDTFKDFELYLEWKIDSGSNSGIFYHVQELDSINAIYASAPEYQLTDKAVPEINVHPDQLTGADYGMYAPCDAKVKPVGQWNETRIIVKGQHVEHWLNGTMVVEYEWGSPEWQERKSSGKWKDYPFYGVSNEGYIGLQDHGGLTCFRNIKIRRL